MLLECSPLFETCEPVWVAKFVAQVAVGGAATTLVVYLGWKPDRNSLAKGLSLLAVWFATIMLFFSGAFDGLDGCPDSLYAPPYEYLLIVSYDEENRNAVIYPRLRPKKGPFLLRHVPSANFREFFGDVGVYDDIAETKATLERDGWSVITQGSRPACAWVRRDVLARPEERSTQRYESP